MPRNEGRVVRLALFLALVAAAPAAHAQKPELREVEHGFSVDSEIGALWFFRLPASSQASASGALLGLSLGGDIGPVRLGLALWGQSLGAGADYAGIGGKGDTHRARGDFQTMLLAVDARVRVLDIEDAQGVARTSLQLRALVGPSLSSPAGVLDRNGIMAAAGPGLLYHTRVRHFAVGLDVLGVLHRQDAGDAVGVSVLPSVRYTF